MSRLEHAEVAIVGGGPVGLGLAIELGQRGVSCVVLERAAAVHRVPKGQNLTQRTMEHFHFWGAEAALRAGRTIPPEYGIGGLTAYGSLLGGYSYDWLQRDLVRDFYFTANERLPQYATETVLRARAAELPAVQTRFGFTADRIAQHPDGVAVSALDRDTGERVEIIVDYLVGCDGSRSMVREAAGITETRSEHDKRMALLVFDSPELHALLQRFPGKSYYNVLHPALEGYWQFFGRVDLGSQFFFHAPVPAGTTAANFDFKAYLRQAVGADFALDLGYIGFWDLRIATADRYRSGRVFIAGDAAHSHPPYGGYGINTGLEDAANLGWKLAAALRGWGGDHLLDSYDEERRPVFLSTARDFIEKSIREDRVFLGRYSPEADREAFETAWAGRREGAKTEVGAFEPNYAGSSITWTPSGVTSALGSHRFEARAGHHLSPQVLSDGRNVFEALGRDFTLLDFGGDPETVEAFEQAARDLHLPLQVIHDGAPAARARYGCSLILVRPDQFIAWAGERPDDVLAVVSRSIG